MGASWCAGRTLVPGLNLLHDSRTHVDHHEWTMESLAGQKPSCRQEVSIACARGGSQTREPGGKGIQIPFLACFEGTAGCAWSVCLGRRDGGGSSTDVSESARRGKETLWGKSEGPMVVLWDSLDEKAKEDVLADLGKLEDWVIWKKAPGTQAEWQEEGFLKTLGDDDDVYWH